MQVARGVSRSSVLLEQQVTASVSMHMLTVKCTECAHGALMYASLRSKYYRREHCSLSDDSIHPLSIELWKTLLKTLADISTCHEPLTPTSSLSLYRRLHSSAFVRTVWQLCLCYETRAQRMLSAACPSAQQMPASSAAVAAAARAWRAPCLAADRSC